MQVPWIFLFFTKVNTGHFTKGKNHIYLKTAK